MEKSFTPHQFSKPSYVPKEEWDTIVAEYDGKVFQSPFVEVGDLFSPETKAAHYALVLAEWTARRVAMAYPRGV